MRGTSHCLWQAITLMALLVLNTNAMAEFERERRALIKDVEMDFRATAYATGLKYLDPAVREAMLKVQRHKFVPPHQVDSAYQNRPLTIGHGQTISQPYIVALMTQLLDVDENAKVLEIGTGSGYQAAVLGELVKKVYSIEIVEALGERSSKLLKELGYRNVEVRIGDGNYGWPEQAPFDGIIVTAAGRVPPALIQQLKPGGRLVIPVDSGAMQELTVFAKDANGTVKEYPSIPVRFVPLTGDN